MTRSLIGLLWLALGCGGSGTDNPPADSSEGCPTSGRYLGLEEGRSWSYKVTDTVTHTVEMKTQTVGAPETLTIHAGVTAFKLTTTKPGGSTDSWQEDTGTEIRRHAENDNSGGTTTTEQYDPFRIRVDEAPAHIMDGATFTSSYSEIVTANGGQATTTAKSENWSVIAAEEMVDVPAGTFCALHVHRVSMLGGTVGSTKDFWFVRGVGKVKEVGDGQTEELTAFTP